MRKAHAYIIAVDSDKSIPSYIDSNTDVCLITTSKIDNISSYVLKHKGISMRIIASSDENIKTPGLSEKFMINLSHN
jgi:glycerol-3-phosphate responsive antiterminator